MCNTSLCKNSLNNVNLVLLQPRLSQCQQSNVLEKVKYTTIYIYRLVHRLPGLFNANEKAERGLDSEATCYILLLMYCFKKTDVRCSACALQDISRQRVLASEVSLNRSDCS